MPLTNIISDKITTSVLSSSLPLSKFTNTTYAQADTSLGQVSNNSFNVAKNTLVSNGGTDATFMAPISAMQNYATAADPANAVAYSTQAANTKAAIENSVNSNVPGYNSSLFDIQTATKTGISDGVNSYGSSINAINPTVSAGATNAGLSSLADTGRIVDSSCSASYNATGSDLNNQISGINNAVANKAQASISGDLSSVQNLPGETPSAITETPDAALFGSTSVGISETDDDGPSPIQNSTDIIYQDIKVYIEGVQVPIEAGSVSQSIGQFPTAMFQVPPQAGLMDIARYYQPKVHIFYTDKNMGGDRLLFWGHIVACNYSRSQQSASATIAFECIHKNALLQQVTFEWSGGGAANVTSGASLTNTDPNAAVVQQNNFNSESSLIRALQGIVGVQSDPKDLISPTNKEVINADPALLDKRFSKFENRLLGMPSAVMNMWNQVKLERYADEKLNVIFSKMFIPLLEDGLKFFDRLAGHYYLENQIQNSRVEHCNDKARPELSKHKTLLPPAYRVDIQSAVQTQMAISSLKSMLGFSGEFTTFYDLFTNFYFNVEYELLTLASPSEVPLDPTLKIDPDNLSEWIQQEKMAIETIIKPQIPFYYAPLCNVILPNMFHTISVTQNEAEIPTRITAVGTAPSQATNNPESLGLNYRAPHSIREGIAIGRQFFNNGVAGTGNTAVTLRDTTGSSFSLPGKYEIGRGIKHKKIMMPDWLSHFTSAQDSGRASNSDQEFPIQGSLDYTNLQNLHFAWVAKYGYTNLYDPVEGTVTRTRDKTLDALDPYSDKSNIMAYERLLFASADYEYTKEVVKSKRGQLSGLFNPYVIPGYPMDIIEGTPNGPSFHAMCASVTHSFSSRSISTDIGFMAAITYVEMSNYYIQPIHPWLRNALSMINVARSDTLTEGGDTEADGADVKSTPDPITSTVPGSSDKTFRTEKSAADTQAATSSQLSTSKGLTPDPVYDSNKGDITSVKEGLLQNPRAKQAADLFYQGVLGVGAADPGQLYDFETGMVLPLQRASGIWIEGSKDSISLPNGGEGNDNLTGVGGLRLVSRPIEGKRSIEAKFGIKFIELLPTNYNGSAVDYVGPTVDSQQLLEPGASLFLDYEDIPQLIKSVETVSTTANTGGDTGVRGGA